jgi:hypothetical protein
MTRPTVIDAWGAEAGGAHASFLGKAAAVMPRLAAELVSVLAVLQDGAPRELDELDALQARRATRLLAMSASADFPKPDRRRHR